MDNLPGCLVVLLIAVVLLAVVYSVLKSIVIVKEGTVVLTELDGRFFRMLKPGRHYMLPMMETVRGEAIKLHQVHFDIPEVVLNTRNFAPVTFGMSVHFQIMRDPSSPYLIPSKEAVYRAIYTVEDWQKITHEEALAAVTEIVAGLDFKASIIDSDNWIHELSERVRSELNDRANHWGVYVDDVNLINVKFSDATREISSFEGKAKRQARLREIEAESERQNAQILGLNTPEQLIQWHYIETMKEVVKNNPQARIIFASPEMMTSQVHNEDMRLLGDGQSGQTQMLPAGESFRAANQPRPTPAQVVADDRPAPARTARSREVEELGLAPCRLLGGSAGAGATGTAGQGR